MVNEQSTGHLSRLAISRILAGENLHEPHLAGCRECQAAVAEARSQSGSIAQRFPTFESLDTVVRRRQANKAPENPSLFRDALQSLDRLFRRFNSPMVGTAFATLLVLGLGTWVWRSANPGMDNDLAAKGDGAKAKKAFFIFINGTQAYGDSLQAGPSDTLQLGIVSPHPVHYAVLFRDDGQALGAYLGGSENQANPLGNPQGEPLPKSLILDGTWKREILYCVWADRPFSIEEAKVLIDAPASKAGDLHLQSIVLSNPAH